MIYYRSCYRCVRVNLPQLVTFEALCGRLVVAGESFLFLAIYRPGSARPANQFYDELAVVLEELVVQGGPITISGDIKIHVEKPDDPDAVRFAALLASFDVVQHVSGSTHTKAGTLDLVMSFSDREVMNVCVDPAGVISDHSVVTCRIPSQQHIIPVASRRVRSWSKVDISAFQDAIRNSPLGRPPSPSSCSSDLFAEYDSVLRQIADQFAPDHTVQSLSRPLALWFDADCRAIRRNCRRLERTYRRTNHEDDRTAWVKAVRQKHADFQSKKNSYWTGRILQEICRPLKLWRSFSKILCRDKDLGGFGTPLRHTPDSFLRFFDDKVKSVRASTDGCPPPDVHGTAPASLLLFRTVDEDEVRRIICVSPTKSCSLDPIPTSILKQVLDVLLPYMTTMFNASLLEGHLPLSQRHAIVTPLIKKQSLDPDELKNYRPVSNLTFVSKAVERLVSHQLIEYLDEHNLMPRLQSAYRRNHSTETALLRVVSDLLAAADNQRVTLLGLLDLSAAFDCVDHHILLQRLESTFGVRGAALSWISSFLLGRTQIVCFGGRLSSIGLLTCGVPQGSVLGPLLFLLYTAELLDLVADCGLTAHSYADDTQVYVGTTAGDSEGAVRRFTECVERISGWMSSNRLKLNAEKTQVIWIGTRQQLAKVDIDQLHLMSANVTFSTTVSNLGVMIDRQLSMADQVAALCRSCFFQLRQLRTVKCSLTADALATLIHAFISSRLDYCNSLLVGVGEGLLQKLQRVQNAAARLVTDTRKYEHITPVLRALHWLPVRQRIVFKVAMLVYKCLHNLAPPYLADDLLPLESMPGRRRLRSVSNMELFIPRTRTVSFGPRAFAVCGPTIWNSLPSELRDPDLTVCAFARKLKTFLFV